MVNVASVALVYVGLRAFGAMDNSLEDMQVISTVIFPHSCDIFGHSSKYLMPRAGARGEKCSVGSWPGHQLLVQLPQVDLHWSVTMFWLNTSKIGSALFSQIGLLLCFG